MTLFTSDSLDTLKNFSRSLPGAYTQSALSFLNNTMYKILTFNFNQLGS